MSDNNAFDNWDPDNDGGDTERSDDMIRPEQPEETPQSPEESPGEETPDSPVEGTPFPDLPELDEGNGRKERGTFDADDINDWTGPKYINPNEDA